MGEKIPLKLIFFNSRNKDINESDQTEVHTTIK